MYDPDLPKRACDIEKGDGMAMTSVNNGVNVQALLDAREVLKGAPAAAKFTWRASCKWQNGTYSKTSVESFFGLGEEQRHKAETKFDADHPEIFASEDRGITPIEYVLVSFMHDSPARFARALLIEGFGQLLLAVEMYAIIRALGYRIGPGEAILLEGAISSSSG